MVYWKCYLRKWWYEVQSIEVTMWKDTTAKSTLKVIVALLMFEERNAGIENMLRVLQRYGISAE